MATEHPQDDWDTRTDKAPFTLKPSAPNPKVPAGNLGGPAIAVLIVWIFAGQGVDVPLEVALAMAALIGALVGYLTPGRIG